eukprot:CAMPEP_0177645862 /NCGR_PEP_ID=MMETSP0447-20121125/9472_1 /TAXON_ID=0 /ORGANISM="Stygamoeba regulata, Strain BSH-02190019" /LENGTH=669 /DNA_ID=CAMNT_0019148367 /DNA_START=109 /DNA_END=2118 /DNA_ORIENTATION=+
MIGWKQNTNATPFLPVLLVCCLLFATSNAQTLDCPQDGDDGIVTSASSMVAKPGVAVFFRLCGAFAVSNMTTVEWSIDGHPFANTADPVVSHTFQQDDRGQRQVSASFTKGIEEETTSVTIYVVDCPSVDTVQILVQPRFFGDDKTVTLTACAPDDEVSRLYQWDFGDGSPKVPLIAATADGVVVHHAWANPGAYLVVLRVIEATDPGATSLTVTQLLSVASAENTDCTGILAQPVVRVGTPLLAQLCPSLFEEANAASSVQWLFGDGSGALPATTALVTHTYTAGAIYELEVTLERASDDDDKDDQDRYAVPVSVVECPDDLTSALIVARPDVVAIDEVQTFTLCLPESSIENYTLAEVLVRWVFEDSTTVDSGMPTAAAQVYSHAWKQSGSHLVHATVVADGQQLGVAALIEVAATDVGDARDCENGIFIGEEYVRKGDSVSIQPCGEALDGGDFMYNYEYGDGSTAASQSNVQHVYKTGGRFNITMISTKNLVPYYRTIGVADCDSYPSSGDIEGMDLHQSQPRTAYLFVCLEDTEQQRQYHWAFGDGTFSNDLNDFQYVVQHTWPENGDYAVNVSVVTLTVDGNTEEQLLAVVRVADNGIRFESLQSSDDDDDLSAGAIVGIVASIVACLLLVAGIGVFARHRYLQSETHRAPDSAGEYRLMRPE